MKIYLKLCSRFGLLLFLILTLGGCSFQPEHNTAVIAAQYRSGIVGKGNSTLNKPEKSKDGSRHPNDIQNVFFTPGSNIHYRLEYSDFYYVTRDVYVDFLPVAAFEHGILYEMNTKESLPIVRFPLYLYVEKNKIYRTWITSDELNNLKSEKQLLQDATLVCQNDGLPDRLTKDQPGEHSSIEKEGKLRESHFYNVNENGDMSGYWESFLWEKDKGLMHYRGGFDAEAEMIELTNVLYPSCLVK